MEIGIRVKDWVVGSGPTTCDGAIVLKSKRQYLQQPHASSTHKHTYSTLLAVYWSAGNVQAFLSYADGQTQGWTRSTPKCISVVPSYLPSTYIYISGLLSTQHSHRVGPSLGCCDETCVLLPHRRMAVVGKVGFRLHLPPARSDMDSCGGGSGPSTIGHSPY